MMTESAKKAIEEKLAKLDLKSFSVLEKTATLALIQSSVEFGYRLGYDEAMRDIAKHPLAHLLLFDPMGAGSKEEGK